jgi:retron-type reverse transcriptase
MIKILEHRIGDPRIMRLISRMLKAGVMEDGLVRASDEGTPQGAILSPLLSNIYLHYALDLWFSKRFEKRCRGQAYYYRFADDFVACFQYQSDAIAFREQLEDRLQGFSLELAPEKTRCIEFGR